MPIPTRSQSVRKPGESGLPTRKPSVRQTSTTTGQDALPRTIQTRSTTHTLPKPANIPDIAQQLTTTQSSLAQPKSSGLRAPTAITTNDTVPNTQSKSARPATASNINVHKPGHLRQQSAAVSSKTPVSAHTRSASTTSTILPSRLAKPRTIPPAPAGRVPTQQRSTKPQADVSGQSDNSTNLRNELLQLQLVHESSASTLASYEQDLTTKRQIETDILHKQHQDLLRLEAISNQTISSTSLRNWLNSHPNQADAQQIQILSNAIATLEQLTTNAALNPLDHFETWLSEALLIHDSRTTPEDPTWSPITSLPPTWHKSVKTLREHLTTINTTFDQFETPAEELSQPSLSSGISWLIRSQKRYVETLLSEVELCIHLERQMVQYESDWQASEVEKAMTRLSSHDEGYDRGRNGIWMA